MEEERKGEGQSLEVIYFLSVCGVTKLLLYTTQGRLRQEGHKFDP